MKKLFGLLVIVAISSFTISCKNDDDDRAELKEVFYTKIDSLRIPMDTMLVGEIQQLRMFSTFKKNCEGLYNVSYSHESDFNRVVSNIAFSTNETCGDGNYALASAINFQPRIKGVYNFKFWNGIDANDENLWIEKNIVVE